MTETLAAKATRADSVSAEFGPVTRSLAAHYFEPVRFLDSAVNELRQLHQRGFVVHVQRTTAWINFLYLSWALVQRGLPPIRAVTSLRPWVTKPWTKTAQTGDFAKRFDYARERGGSALIFLRQSAFNTARGVETVQDPFPALVELARTGNEPVFLVPELFVWEKWQQKVAPSVFDRIFGSPEAPGFLHSLGAFWRNYRRAQFRVGTPLDLRAFVKEHEGLSTQLIARKVRGALHHHLARETRAVFGPPAKGHERLLDEAMRDRTFQSSLQEIATRSSKPLPAVEKIARSNLDEIASKYSPTVVGGIAPVLNWVFNRIYDGVEVDEAGLERAMKMGSDAPLVLTPSHKSHVDYLIMSYVLFSRGYKAPLVAAGANLSFFPLGPILRRAGAFFLRRSFKGDHVYTAAFKAYLRKLVHDGIHHEFFPEGGRSRTGKLLTPKLGMFTWLVEALLDGTREDLLFVPTAIDYEKVVESASYKHELQGGEKKPEDLTALLSAPKVLSENYGRIHLRFDEPVSLKQMMEERGLSPKTLTEDEKKSLVRALAHRVMYGISRVSTVTPHALLASGLLAHRRRGIAASELTERITFLRQIATSMHAPLSPQLSNSPSSPVVLGAVQDAMRMFASSGFVKIIDAHHDPIFQVDEARRTEMSFYKNTLINLIAGITIVSSALRRLDFSADRADVSNHAQFVSRLFKFEFVFPVGRAFDAIFDETVVQLERLGLIIADGTMLKVAPEAHARATLDFLADLLRDFFESYALVIRNAAELTEDKGLEKKEFFKRLVTVGTEDFQKGVLMTPESISKPIFENAVQFLVDQRFIVDENKRVTRGSEPFGDLAERVRAFAKAD